MKSSWKAKAESFRWHHEYFVVRIEFMLAMAIRKCSFPISTILTKYPKKYLVNVLKSWVTCYSWILSQIFRKQRYDLYNGRKINDIKLRSARLSDSLSFQVSSPKLMLAIHSEQIVSNFGKNPVGLGLFGPDYLVICLAENWEYKAVSSTTC